MTWLLLIYTVPAQPSRYRATVWRELKRAGAVYLRDGVCALPETEAAWLGLKAIADKVEEFKGQATLARGVQLDDASAEAIRASAREARGAEYSELEAELFGLLGNLVHERERRRLNGPELQELTADLDKLRRWSKQITDRDFTRQGLPVEIGQMLDRCASELRVAAEDTKVREATPA